MSKAPREYRSAARAESQSTLQLGTPGFASHSLFRRAPTSQRHSDVREPLTGKALNWVMKKVDETQFASERLALGVTRFWQRLRGTQQDSYGSRFKAFDKIAVVRGGAWARVETEWVVPLLHTVSPPELFRGTEKSAPFFPEARDARLRAYRSLIGEDPKLFDELCETISKMLYVAPTGSRSSGTSASSPTWMTTLLPELMRAGEVSRAFAMPRGTATPPSSSTPAATA
jgi:hypothetical protein